MKDRKGKWKKKERQKESKKKEKNATHLPPKMPQELIVAKNFSGGIYLLTYY